MSGRSVKPPTGMVRVIINADFAAWKAYKAAAKAAGYKSASEALRDHLAAGPRSTPKPKPKRAPAKRGQR